MLNGDPSLALYRMADRLREAEAARLSKATRRARTADERGVTRRVGRAALAVALWPVKH